MHKDIRTGDIERHIETTDALELLHLWRKAAKPGQLPPLSLLNSYAWVPFEHEISICEKRDNGWIYIACGRTICDLLGESLEGQWISQRPAAVREFFNEAFDLAISDGAPVATVHNDARDLTIMLWQRLLLPFAGPRGLPCVVTHHSPLESTAGITRSVLNAAASGISGYRCIRDDDRQIIDAVYLVGNERAAQLLQKPSAGLPGQRILQMFPGAVQSGVWEKYVRVVETREPCHFEVHYDYDGLNAWFSVSCVPMGDGFTLSFADVTAMKVAHLELERAHAALQTEIECRRMLEDELRRLATVDVLTGVANRRSALEEGAFLVTKARRSMMALSAVTLDIDHFKRINDTYGHAGGDAVLSAFGSLLREAADEVGAVAGRLGGEEFVVFLPGTREDEAALFGEGLRAAIAARPFEADGETISATTSVGVAELQIDDDVDSLLAAADAALYAAKREGRNRVVRATPRQQRQSVA